MFFNQLSPPRVSPLADDLSVGFHQVVRDVSPRQVLQSVGGAQFHLKTTRETVRFFYKHHIHTFDPKIPSEFMSRSVSCGLTSGGGRPPAPAGQSGNIFFLPLQLQKQAGDGSSMVQFLELNSCWTLSGTSGMCQSSSPMVQGASLRTRRTESVMIKKQNVCSNVGLLTSLSVLRDGMSFHAASPKAWSVQKSV